MLVNVVGLGESAKSWNGEGFSIGVNDAFRFRPTNYLMVINAPNKFNAERLKIITESKPEKFIAHNYGWQKWFPDMEYIVPVSFTSAMIKDKVYCSRTSPFAAMSYAYNMGAKEIVLWGVDFKTHKYFYPGSGDLRAEMGAYSCFIEALTARGCNVYQGVEGSELKLPVYAK